MEHDPLSKDQLDQDWKTADNYTAYSAELLRMALLAITGIATLLFKISGGSAGTIPKVAQSFKYGFFAFMVCAACALWHRYVATDAMVYYIGYLRRSARAAPVANEKHAAVSQSIRQEKRGFHRRLRLATCLLVISALALVAGVIACAKPVVDALATTANSTQVVAPGQKPN